MDKLKDLEEAVKIIKFYPVAVDEKKKNSAIKKLKERFKKGDQVERQVILYFIHDALSAITEYRLVHNHAYFKQKGQDPKNIQMSVYRAIFGYVTSIEGLIELIELLGDFGTIESTKLLTYYYGRVCLQENEFNATLRNAIIAALGESKDKYALKALLRYAKYNSGERTIQQILYALEQWQLKLDSLKIPKREKNKLKQELEDFFIKEQHSSHYR